MLRHIHQIVLAATTNWATGADIQDGAFAWVTGLTPLPDHLRRGPLALPRERGYRASTERHAELRRRIYLAFRELEQSGYTIKVEDPQVDEVDDQGRMVIEWRFEPAPSLWWWDMFVPARAHFSPRAGGYLAENAAPVGWRYLHATEAGAVRSAGMGCRRDAGRGSG